MNQSRVDSLERPSGGQTVLFVRSGDPPSAESDAAFAWLSELPDLDAREIALADLPGSLPSHPSTLWLHWADPPDLEDSALLAIDAHVRGGGGLFATLAAVTLPVLLGWETVSPNETTMSNWSEGSEDTLASDFSQQRRMRGLQSFRGHPLFEGLGGGAYTWAPRQGEPFVRYAYAGDRWPERGRVVAVEKSFIAMNADRRLAWEYDVEEGWAVCVGGYVYFSSSDVTYRPHLEHLVRNAIRRVTPDGHSVREIGGVWTLPRLGLTHDEQVQLPPPILPAQHADSDLTLEREATDNEYTLAGSRALVVGRERSGLEEIWFHPNRAVSRWMLNAVDSAGEGLPEAIGEHIRVSPGQVERNLDLGGQTVHERTVVDQDRPAVVVELSADTPIQAVWTLESDMRLMWPYPSSSIGGLSYVHDFGAVGVSTDTGEWLGVRVEPTPVSLDVLDVSDHEISRVCVTAKLDLSHRTQILICGSAATESHMDTVSGTRKSLSYKDVTLASPLSTIGVEDPTLREALGWAADRLARYRVHVPGLGACLVAGYGRSREGEFGDGRPGYAWFFGRDACWTGLACLAAGEWETARETLEFLGGLQDITGKILHECTTSGVVHYDAADSTPLYLLLAARYHSVTGDGATLEREWPRIVKAYEFCLSTDSDGDGLIENTGVGHGWIEFGRLGEHHVSLYLAGVWVGALSELEVCARTLGKGEFADEVAYRAATARATLELSFFDPLEDRYATGRRADGSKNMAETAMTAVPLLLGALTPERCSSWLDRIAEDDFTAGWGVRLVPRSDPDYEPDGYHAGSIWPLFTGWVSLAERRAGRVESAERHARQVASLYKACALGAWPEVLHGDEPRCIGVTSDQAWSTAMAVLAAV